jgi:hypothetical protein
MRMRFILPGIILLIASQIAQPADESHSYRDEYVKRTLNKEAAVRVGAGAVFQTARNSPHEWGRTVGGFGKRVGSALGEHVLKKTIEFGVASVRHEELGYRPSGKSRFRPRLKYALVSTVMTRKTTTGERTAALGRISGDFGSGLISRVWQPARLRTVGSGFATGGIMLGVDAGTHVVREFWPEIRHPRNH